MATQSATGHTQPLEAFVYEAFAAVNLDWREYVDKDPRLMRPTDLAVSRADPNRAAQVLGWRARTLLPGVVQEMVRGCQPSTRAWT